MTWINAHLAAAIVAASCAVGGLIVVLAAVFGDDPSDI